jgi:hypothetical protein
MEITFGSMNDTSKEVHSNDLSDSTHKYKCDKEVWNVHLDRKQVTPLGL